MTPIIYHFSCNTLTASSGLASLKVWPDAHTWYRALRSPCMCTAGAKVIQRGELWKSLLCELSVVQGQLWIVLSHSSLYQLLNGMNQVNLLIAELYYSYFRKPWKAIATSRAYRPAGLRLDHTAPNWILPPASSNHRGIHMPMMLQLIRSVTGGCFGTMLALSSRSQTAEYPHNASVCCFVFIDKKVTKDVQRFSIKMPNSILLYKYCINSDMLQGNDLNVGTKCPNYFKLWQID